MPKRKFSRNSGGSKEEADGGNEDENPFSTTSKRPRGRPPRTSKTPSVEWDDKEKYKEPSSSNEQRRPKFKKPNNSRSASSDKELIGDLSSSVISDEEAHEDDDDDDSVFGIDEEKQKEPEKRNLRATNSRRSREAMAKHLLLAAASSSEQQEGKINSDKSVSKKSTSDNGEKSSHWNDNANRRNEEIKEEKNEGDNPVETNYSEEVGSRMRNDIKEEITEMKKFLYTDDKESTRNDEEQKKGKEKGDEDSVQKCSLDDQTNIEKIKEEEDDDTKMVADRNQSDFGTESNTSKPAKNRAKVHHRHGIDFRIGGRLEACDFMANWYASKIVDIDWNEREVLIHFERWSSRFDEWVSMDSPRLRAIARTSARKEYKQKLQQEFKVGENILAKWVDGKMYPAKVVAVNGNGSCQVVFLDDGIQKTIKPINLMKVSKEEFAFHVSQTSEKKRKKRENSGSKQSRGKGRSTSSDGEESPDSRSHSRKSEDSAPSKRLVKQKKNEGKMSSSAYSLAMRKKKLLVGGIFQAKRTFQNPNPRSRQNINKKTEKLSERKIASRVKLKPQKDAKPAGNTVTEENTLPRLDDVVDSQPVGLPEATTGDDSKQRKPSGGAPKEFIIEEDHNHFKCPTENCGKSFRKESLLASHMKHYHDHSPKPRQTRRRESGGAKIDVSNSPACSDAGKSLEEPGVESEDKTIEGIDTTCEPPSTSSTSVRRKRGSFQRSFPKHKMKMAKRRPMLVYRHKMKDQECEEDESEKDDGKKMVANVEKDGKDGRKLSAAKEETKKRPMKKAAAGQNSEFQPDNTSEISSDIQQTSGNMSPLSPVSRKIGRKRRWRCSVRSPKNEPFMNVICGSNNAKPAIGSPEVSSPMEKYAFEDDDDDDRREEVVNCICRILEEDGLMMQCETCMAWQHGVCFNIEEEDKVPEKYICFACKNPEGQRESYRYWYDQDWWKLGEMATFNFVPKEDSGFLSASMLKAHALAGGVYSVKKLLHSLQQKIDYVKDKEYSDTSLWSKTWCEESLQPKPNSGNWNSPSQDGMRRPAMFLDHSYSAVTRKSMDSSYSHSPAVDLDDVLKEENDKEVKEDVIGDVNSDGKQQTSNSEFSNLEESDSKLDKSRSEIHLLDHIDQMQDEVDHRLDEITQHIEVLEAEWEDGAFGSSSNMSMDLPAIKKMLKGLQLNLEKVQRLATYQ